MTKVVKNQHYYDNVKLHNLIFYLSIFKTKQNRFWKIVCKYFKSRNQNFFKWKIIIKQIFPLIEKLKKTNKMFRENHF